LLGQIFDACRISAPKWLAVIVNTKKIVQYRLKHLFGAETSVAEIRQTSNI